MVNRLSADRKYFRKYTLMRDCYEGIIFRTCVCPKDHSSEVRPFAQTLLFDKMSLPNNNFYTPVRLVRLWDLSDELRSKTAESFVVEWPDREREINSIRTGLYTPARKSVPLVLVPFDRSGTRADVLGYTIIYPSSTVKRPTSMCASVEVGVYNDVKVPEFSLGSALSNCTLNSVLVPEPLRCQHLGQALVRLAVSIAVRELGYHCVTIWCQPKMIHFYKRCGFGYIVPNAAQKTNGELSKYSFRKTPSSRQGVDSSKSPLLLNGSLDECMRIFADTACGT